MAIVVTLDQRESRGAADRVSEWSDWLNSAHAARLRLPFVRSAGDELQGVLSDPEALADIVAESVGDRGWWLGVGVGPIDRFGDTARDSQGPAFWHARKAVEAAKTRSHPQPVAVVGEPQDEAAALGDALNALAFITLRRTPEQRESVQLLRGGMKNKDIAAHLGVSPAAISQRLRGAGAEEEAGLRRLITSIASRLLEP
ncbi:MAG TPA: SatD family protein [Thermoleophilaceae bacterium]|nr:SatD family protein [Thermoleophilaceae bacterium]